MLRKLVIGVLLAGAMQHGAQAAVIGSERGQALTQEGLGLISSGQLKAAREKFQQAAALDPEASYPVGALAMLYQVLSAQPQLSGQEREAALGAARQAAQRALSLDARDPLAQEVLRRLAGGSVREKYLPLNNAGAMVEQGEQLFAKKDYAGALAQYERAIAADPQYADAWVYAGDCHFSLQQWQQAAQHFSKATQVDPLHEQAWRFLSDALQHQEKWPEMEAALAGAIGAHPDQSSAWQRMAQFQSTHGVPLVALGLQVKARGSIDADGKPRVQIQSKSKSGNSADLTPQEDAFWLALALAQADGLQKRAQQKSGDSAAAGASPFEIELAAWRAALVALDEMEKKQGLQLRDGGVLAMRKLAAAGQLEPALLLLQYRPAYRPALEAWKSAHPNGVAQFVNTTHMMP